MLELLFIIIFWVGTLLLLVAAFFTGKAEEKKHYESLVAREEAVR